MSGSTFWGPGRGSRCLPFARDRSCGPRAECLNGVRPKKVNVRSRSARLSGPWLISFGLTANALSLPARPPHDPVSFQPPSGHLHFAWFQRHDLSLRCFLARPGISGDCGYVVVKLGRELVANLPNLGNNWISWHRSGSHQFFRSANHRAVEAVITTYLRNLGRHFGIGDMSAVPSHEEFDAVDRGNGNVQRVPRCLRGKRS